MFLFLFIHVLIWGSIMNAKGLFDSVWLMHLVIVVWIVSSVFSMLLLSRLDGIVHGDLYDYGLQFSFDWAVPFWSFERLIYVCLALPCVLGGFVLFFDFWKSRDRAPVVRRVEAKPSGGAFQPLKENQMLISCPKCGKVFSKPLTMLDFSGGKTRLVNVCPYCNHVLGSAEEEKGEDSDIGVLDLDKEKEIRH